MEIVVKGRNVEIPDHYRVHVAEKLAKVERYDEKIIRIEVVLTHERNPRQSEQCQRVEITCISRGPAVRSEACTADFYSALDAAATKLESRLRRTAERRRVSRGRRTPVSVAAATADLPVAPADVPLFAAPGPGATTTAEPEYDGIDDDQPWHIAREKVHAAEPMTVEDALFQMELVGHDFYLFQDKESGRPSVVYRRRAYDYGIISLDV